MFERNKVANAASEHMVLVPVELEADGETLKGSLVVPQSKSVFHLLNDAAGFVQFEPFNGVPYYLAKSTIRSVRQMSVPAAALQNGSRGNAFDPYATLGLEKGASWDDVRDAYRAKVKLYHPDRYANVELPAEISEYFSAMVRRLTVAFSALEEPHKAGQNKKAQQSTPVYSSRMSA